MITHENIEEYIIDYLSDELNEAERMAVDDFIQNNPQYLEMLKEFQHTFLDQNSFSEITYSKKEALLKSSTKINFIQKINWKYVAGIALILVSGAYLILNNTSDNSTFSDTITNHIDDKKTIQNTIQTTDNKNQNTVAKNNNISLPKNLDHKNQSNHTNYQTNKSKNNLVTIEKTKSNVPLISKLNPIQYKLEKQEPEIIVYTQFISNPSISKRLITETDNNDFEIAIGNKTIDINLDRLNEIKSNIDNLKDVVVKKVEDTSFDSINLWDIISK